MRSARVAVAAGALAWLALAACNGTGAPPVPPVHSAQFSPWIYLLLARASCRRVRSWLPAWLERMEDRVKRWIANSYGVLQAVTEIHVADIMAENVRPRLRFTQAYRLREASIRSAATPETPMA